MTQNASSSVLPFRDQENALKLVIDPVPPVQCPVTAQITVVSEMLIVVCFRKFLYILVSLTIIFNHGLMCTAV